MRPFKYSTQSVSRHSACSAVANASYNKSYFVLPCRAAELNYYEDIGLSVGVGSMSICRRGALRSPTLAQVHDLHTAKGTGVIFSKENR